MTKVEMVRTREAWEVWRAILPGTPSHAPAKTNSQTARLARSGPPI